MSTKSFGGFGGPLSGSSQKFRDVRVNSKWRSKLYKLLEEDNAIHNTTTTLRERVSKFSGNVETLTVKTAKTQAEDLSFSENLQHPTAKTAKTSSGAKQLDLVAAWSIEFGYISIHDPTTGEWHDLQTKEAPDWARWEAHKRKELYKGGNRKAYRLTSREIEMVWKKEQVETWDHPAVTDKGVVYEDNLEGA